MFKVVAKSNSEADILLYGDIGFWSSISADVIYAKLNDLKKKGYTKINMKIHSRGGEVYEGIALYNLLRTFDAKTTATIEGVSASMMSIVMLGADKVKMVDSALIMLHQPRSGQRGTAKKMEEVAKHLRKLTDEMAEIYANRTGKTVEFVKENWLKDDEDVWFTAKEAKEAGLIDEIVKSKNTKIKALLDNAEDYGSITAQYDDVFNVEKIINKPKSKMNRDLIIKALQSTKIPFDASASDEELFNLQISKMSELAQQNADMLQKSSQAEARLKEAKLQRLKEKMTQKQIPTSEVESLLAIAETNFEQVERLVEARVNPVADLRGQVQQGQVSNPSMNNTQGQVEFSTFEEYQEKNPKAFVKLLKENPEKAQRLAKGYKNSAFGLV